MHESLIDQYLAALRTLRRAERTIATYQDILTRANRQLPHGLAYATPDELTKWLGSTRRATSTQATYTTALRGFYEWAVGGGWMEYAPGVSHAAAELVRPKKPRRVPRPATSEQVAAIMERGRNPVRLWAIIAALAGARAIEISRMDRMDINEHEVRLHGKGDHERLVPTHPDLWAAVQDLPPGLLAGGRDARAVANKAWWEFRSHVGVPISIHKLRSFFATEARRGGADTRTLQELLGHASLATTQVYLGTDPAALRSAVAGLPSLVSLGS